MATKTACIYHLTCSLIQDPEWISWFSISDSPTRQHWRCQPRRTGEDFTSKIIHRLLAGWDSLQVIILRISTACLLWGVDTILSHLTCWPLQYGNLIYLSAIARKAKKGLLAKKTVTPYRGSDIPLPLLYSIS